MITPTRLLATKQEIDAAKSGKDPELARKYREALEEIAEAALEIHQAQSGKEDWDKLYYALRKVYHV